jgi:hypothetical protein
MAKTKINKTPFFLVKHDSNVRFASRLNSHQTHRLIQAIDQNKEKGSTFHFEGHTKNLINA